MHSWQGREETGALDNNNYYPLPTLQVGNGCRSHITFGL